MFVFHAFLDHSNHFPPCHLTSTFPLYLIKGVFDDYHISSGLLMMVILASLEMILMMKMIVNLRKMIMKVRVRKMMMMKMMT